MTDRELLENAAKAGGIETEHDNGAVFFYNEFKDVWCPLDDDADAFRLMVKLDLQVIVEDARCGGVSVCWGDEYQHYLSEESENPQDIYRATRRAIVLVAAEIGKALP